MKNLAIIGAAGYVSPRHMKETGNNLVATLDTSLDSHNNRDTW